MLLIVLVHFRIEGVFQGHKWVLVQRLVEMGCMGFDTNDFDVMCVHHIHVVVIKCVLVMAVHCY